MANRWKQVGNLLIPGRYPEKIGLGCPKCDDSEFIRYTPQVTGQNPTIERFLKKHQACGVLETLEVHNGRTEVTGELREKSS